MKLLRILVVVAMLAPGMLVAGCGGGGAEVKAESKSQGSTLGQELMDLEESYKRGIISESEYISLKHKIIEQRTK